MKSISLNTQVIIALIGSIIFALVYNELGFHPKYVEEYIGPIGQNFLNLLQLILVPLVIVSIIASVNNAKDAGQLARIGILTFCLYMVTTFFAVSLGVFLGNLLVRFSPFSINLQIPKDEVVSAINEVKDTHCFIPNNLFQLFSSNNYLLQIVLFAIVFGIALLNMESKKKSVVLELCENLQDIFSKIMHYIVALSPLGIFSIITCQLTVMFQKNQETMGENLLGLGCYTVTVIIGLGIMTYVVYPLLIKLFTKVPYIQFLKEMAPAQLVAFTTATSTGSLYTTTKQVAKLGVSERIRGFVLTLGATVNMDGTALYQGVATLFILHITGIKVDIQGQCYIVIFVTVSSIGVAGTPGASLITTYVLLQALNIDPYTKKAAVALILIPDRLLDMCRTATNITGDAAVAVMVEAYESKRIGKETIKE